MDVGEGANLQLPEWAQSTLEKTIGNEDKLAVAQCDLTLDGRYSDGWIVLTKNHLALIIAKDDGDSSSPETQLTVLPVNEIDDLSIEALIGNARLYATVNGKRFTFARFSHSHRREVESLVRIARMLKEGKLEEPQKVDEHTAKRRKALMMRRMGLCPRCGNPIHPRWDICPRCLNKSRAFIRMLEFVRPYWHIAIFTFVLMLILSAFETIQPLFAKLFLDRVIPQRDIKLLIIIATAILVINALTALLSAVRGYIMAWLGEKIVVDIRRRLYEHIHSLSLTFFDRRDTGRIISRITDDTHRLNDFLTGGLQDIARDALVSVAIGIILFALDYKLAIVTMIPMPLLAISSVQFGKRVRRLFHRTWRRWAQVTSLLADKLPGVRVIKAFVQEHNEIRKFTDTIYDLFNASLRVARLWTVFFPTIGFVTTLGYLAIWGFGGYWVIKGSMSVGTMIAFLGYLWRFYAPVQNLARITHRLQHAATAAERIFEVLDTESDMEIPEDAVELDEVKGHIVVENVSFSYDGVNKALKEISFEIQPGEMIGLVGPTGAGKSTLINLICRFYDPDEGHIYIDGHDLRNVRPESLRRHIGVVLQDTYLFNGTISENIAYGKPDASREEIIAAAYLANAHEFICKAPYAYDTVVGEHGSHLSGGEKQRIAIARALLRDPAILILDEATSNVDTETEAKIREAIERLIEGRTTIAIAHRFSTLQNARKLIVLDRGQLVEMGTPEELMEKDGMFARLCRMQAELSKTWAW
ncbi:MAG: ABC transporter transmembrane domain-containing protein [Armatimonadota bacterium]|nr:ABC transporter transmembrane domain-containing protein [Armatimonadota bacterium]MCX7776712.1 ABC transporter transmembrane domain-containing protein [Armatimonadota bacterium]MDW8025780.1 ABC transporter transmembrane domain-containing protein [Armatimonadota bacterium]